MRRRLGVVALVLVAGCSGGGGGDATPTPTPTPTPAPVDHTFVVSAIDLPTNGTEATALGLDIDDAPSDGIDNQMGAVFSAFGALVPSADLQFQLDEKVDRGLLVMLANVSAAELADATSAELTILVGTTSMSPAACDGPTDTVCRKHLTGSGAFDVDPLGPTDGTIVGAIAGGVFTGGPAAQLTIPFSIFGGEPFLLPLQQAKAQISGLASSGWTSAGSKIGGAILQSDLDTIVIPEIAQVARSEFDEACDVGSVAADCGCAGGSNGATWRNLYDNAPTQDCTISDAEVAAVWNGFATPDIDLDDDGTNDAISIGIGVTAVSGSFTVP